MGSVIHRSCCSVRCAIRKSKGEALREPLRGTWKT